MIQWITVNQSIVDPAKQKSNEVVNHSPSPWSAPKKGSPAFPPQHRSSSWAEYLKQLGLTWANQKRILLPELLHIFFSLPDDDDDDDWCWWWCGEHDDDGVNMVMWLACECSPWPSSETRKFCNETSFDKHEKAVSMAPMRLSRCQTDSMLEGKFPHEDVPMLTRECFSWTAPCLSQPFWNLLGFGTTKELQWTHRIESRKIDYMLLCLNVF